jgi:serine protease Do
MDPDSSYGSSSIMEVFLNDGRQVQAEFVGGDEQTDLAIIKIDMKNLTPAQYGDSSKLKAGELALVIGNPLGISLAGSVTKGCISAVSRTINTGSATITLIQTDAAVNPGNSGGALLNSQGKVIGIVNAKISETDVEGLGFAIPINDAKPILEQLKESGYVKGRPFIGIRGSQITEAISQQYGIPVGVYVVSVQEKSAADTAGIKQGDVIIQMEDKDVASMSDIEAIKKGHKPGDAVNIKLVRNGKEMTVKLIFGEDKR